MKIPKSIPVFGKVYKVKIVKGLKDEEGEIVSGLHSYDKGTISLCSTLKGEDLVQTFLHELGHAVHDRTGVIQGNLSDDMKEILVETMATFLSETFHLRMK